MPLHFSSAAEEEFIWKFSFRKTCNNSCFEIVIIYILLLPSLRPPCSQREHDHAVLKATKAVISCLLLCQSFKVTAECPLMTDQNNLSTLTKEWWFSISRVVRTRVVVGHHYVLGSQSNLSRFPGYITFCTL